MVESTNLNGVTSAKYSGASSVRQVTVRQGVVDSTIISGDGNIVTVIYQYNRTEPDSQPRARTSTTFPPNPYKGLEAFYEDDTDRFFGRRAVVDTLWRRLRDLEEPPLPGKPVRTRLLAIIGPSGCGKSSVARAGLVPQLTRRPIPGQANPRVAVFVPQTEPIEALATVLVRLATHDPAPVEKTREFAAQIRRVSPSGLTDGLRRIANVLPGADRHPLILLVDQFEEVFTGGTETDRSLFIDTLLDAASRGSGRISVVLTLRSDFLSASARYPALDAAIAAGSELVPAMSEGELEEAISLPAAHAAEHARIPNPLGQGTAELLVRETVGRSGALPLLQFALNRIWEGLANGTPAPDTLRKLGGVGGALAAEADRLLHDLAEVGKEDLVRRAFLAMVQLGEGVEDTRRRARLSEIVAGGEPPDDVVRILRRFARPGERLVTFGSDRGEITLEVTHEQLIACWPRLRSWLRDWREDERFRRRLATAADDWREGQGSLWGPTELELFRRWQERPGQVATPAQHQFIDASNTAFQSQQRKARRAAILTRATAAVFLILFLGTAALAVGLVGASVEADERSQAANAAAREGARETARAQASVARFENEQGRRFEAASAALRGMIVPFDYGAEFSQTELWIQLVRAWSADGFLVPPLEHRGAIHTATFDPAGERLVTASDDHTARIWDAKTGRQIRKPLLHEGPVYTAAFDPRGERVVTASADKTARIWETGTGEPMEPLRHAGFVSAAAFDPSGERVVTASADKTARIWNVRTGEPIGKPLQHRDTVGAAAFDPKGERVVTASYDATARIWDARTGEPIGKPLQHTQIPGGGPLNIVYAANFDSAGERIVTAGDDATARIWDARTGKPIGKLLEHNNTVRAAVFDPKGERVVTASKDNTARIWDARTGEPIGKPLQHADWVWAAAFDPAGGRVVTGSADKTARIWDSRTQEPIGKPLLHADSLEAATFDPKGESVVTASDDKTARIWDVRTSEQIDKKLQHNGAVRVAVFDPRGERALTGSYDKTARIWNVRTGELISKPLQHADHVLAAAFDPTGERVITGSWDKTARIWNAHSGEPIGKPMQHSAAVSAVAFDPTGERVVTASADATARVWNAVTGEPVAKPMHHSDIVRAAAFDPSGERIVTASADKTARIWDARTGEPTCKPLRHADAVHIAVFDPKGERVLTASEDNTARLWDVRSCETICKPLQHDGAVFAAAFDPHGESIITGSWDNTARIWDARTGEPIGHPLQHAGTVWSVAFDPQSERVVTGSWDKTARIWDARTGEPIGKPLQHEDVIRTVSFDPAGERVLTASEDGSAGIWRAPPTGQALVEKIRAILGHNAPEPLKLPENADRGLGYGALVAIGAQTLWARVWSLLLSK